MRQNLDNLTTETTINAGPHINIAYETAKKTELNLEILTIKTVIGTGPNSNLAYKAAEELAQRHVPSGYEIRRDPTRTVIRNGCSCYATVDIVPKKEI
ncbi:MAG: hypothetical protein U9R08_04055 [Nanoarchaeota archaeon]|nr:hypothetical protein [Nanoarchaeota archaeon]